MAHESRVVANLSPGDRHSFDGIPFRHRSGNLDRICPLCAGHGQWNNEFDLASQRSKRTICPTCDGRGWIETGSDMVHSDDIVLSESGYPDWIVRLDPPGEHEQDTTPG
ncbi:hypothetical protein ACWPM1_11395 [Tsuneonella sp. HG249]